MIGDTGHMTYDRWGEVNPLSKLWFGLVMVWDRRCFGDIFTKDELPNELMKELITKVLVEQPRLHPVC